VSIDHVCESPIWSDGHCDRELANSTVDTTLLLLVPITETELDCESAHNQGTALPCGVATGLVAAGLHALLVREREDHPLRYSGVVEYGVGGRLRGRGARAPPYPRIVAVR
jgi:hypothetical protein